MSDKKSRNKDKTPVPENPIPEEVTVEEAVKDCKEPPTAESNPLQTAENNLERDRYLRLAAEYDNYRKRQAKEREALYADVRADTILRLLPVYDNLERALLTQTEDEAYYKGISMIMTQFQEIMENLGVTQIPALGKPFNPECHNAVMHIEDDTLGENEVTEVFQQGFMLGGKVIRCAMVKVAN